MIFGSITIDEREGAVHTHRDSYLLDQLTVASVRRPLLPIALLFGVGLVGFAARFGDLLYESEIVIAIGAGALALLIGTQIGQLKLLSRDLRGSELSGAVWGRYGRLNQARRGIARALAASRGRTA